ncbi:hypothetical protein KPL71_004109 [Citrus sinensis]|uniref:Uncharacterized protein n=1 Tax=Citrus sinensis TaxID=2711 RepID=A0ACB8N3E8_CITSI|nr:hypothetical protein KPL71_004109 [Citrus sinensis]
MPVMLFKNYSPLRPWNVEETITYANFADCVELQTELKRLKLRKNNWNSDTYEFDELFTESTSQKCVYEVIAKPVVEAECLKVTASSFMSSLKTTVDAIQQTLLIFLISLLMSLAGPSLFPKILLVSPCGDLSSDLRTWLSAALINHETCIDGFDGTNSIVKGVVSGSLNQISLSVQELLTMVHPSPNQWSNGFSNSNSGGKGCGGGGKSNQKFLLVNGVQGDVVVAADALF